MLAELKKQTVNHSATQRLATAGSPEAEGMEGGGGVTEPRVRADWRELATVGTTQQELNTLREAVTAKTQR